MQPYFEASDLSSLGPNRSISTHGKLPVLEYPNDSNSLTCETAAERCDQRPVRLENAEEYALQEGQSHGLQTARQILSEPQKGWVLGSGLDVLVWAAQLLRGLSGYRLRGVTSQLRRKCCEKDAPWRGTLCGDFVC